MSRQKVLLLGGLIGLVGLAACGGGSNGSGSSSSDSAAESSSADSSSADETTSTTIDPDVVVEEFTDAEGWAYRLTFTPLPPDPAASLGECVDTAPPGQTNVRLELVVENLLDDRDAPWPDVVTGLNLAPDGSATVAATSIEEADFRGIEISPYAPDTACILANAVSDYQSDPSAPELVIPAGGSEEFEIVAGPVADPPPAGSALLVRMFREAGDGIDIEVPLPES